MFDQILMQMRNKIRNRDYVMTYHAREEMVADNYSVYDVEQGILTGEIVERQKYKNTAEWKYRIRGHAINMNQIEIIGKLSPTGKLVIITIFEPKN